MRNVYFKAGKENLRNKMQGRNSYFALFVGPMALMEDPMNSALSVHLLIHPFIYNIIFSELCITFS